MINFQSRLSDSQLCEMPQSCQVYFYQCPEDVWLLWSINTEKMALWTNTVPVWQKNLGFKKCWGRSGVLWGRQSALYFNILKIFHYLFNLQIHQQMF